jgi:hypothetical protein
MSADDDERGGSGEGVTARADDGSDLRQVIAELDVLADRVDSGGMATLEERRLLQQMGRLRRRKRVLQQQRQQRQPQQQASSAAVSDGTSARRKTHTAGIPWGALAKMYAGPVIFVLFIWFFVNALPDTGARGRVGNRRDDLTTHFPSKSN